MKLLTSLSIALTLGLVLALPGAAHADEVKITIEKAPPPHPHVIIQPHPDAPIQGQRASVELAILLDTSNSMDGLIAQAKQQVWSIINQFANAKKNGQTPVFRVALFEYGNNGLPAAEGYIRQVVPLTTDLDKLSEELFALTTNGGDEYCGQVISEAVKRLDWSKEPNSYKAIFIAGNEPFTQGSMPYQDACQDAITRGIIINTIHCGPYKTGVDTHWAHGAQLAEGDYLNIDQDQTVVHIDAPQDKIIIELNAKLNRTYLWYGAEAEVLRENQVAQDGNAMSVAPSVAVQRARTKSSGNYANVGRDLVDTIQKDADVLKTVEAEDLPKEMRTMTEAEQKAHIEKMSAERAAIQAQIKQLTAEREQYVQAERAKLAKADDEATLGDVMSQTVTRQLEAAGFALGE